MEQISINRTYTATLEHRLSHPLQWFFQTETSDRKSNNEKGCAQYDQCLGNKDA